MSNGRLFSLALATSAGIAGGYYTFKPELDDLQKERELKQKYAGSPNMKNVVEKPADGKDAASLSFTEGKGQEAEPS